LQEEAENLKRLIDNFVEEGINPRTGLFYLFLESFITRVIVRHPKGEKIAKIIMQESEVPITEEECKLYLERMKKLKKKIADKGEEK